MKKRHARKRLIVDAFYLKLRQMVRSGWKARIDYDTGELHLRASRGRRYCFCPVTAVCKAMTGRNFSVHEFQRAASIIGLHYQSAEIIVNAADGSVFCSSTIRRRLMMSCGLKNTD